VKYIGAGIKREPFAESWYRLVDENSDQSWAKYRSTIVKDHAKFDGASLSTICTHFETWVDAQGKRDYWNKFRMCIMVDEESPQTLRDGLMEDAEKDGYESRCVKILEAFPIVDSLDAFHGWMTCWTHLLWDVWVMMGDDDKMRIL
jgi:hypothetical protein